MTNLQLMCSRCEVGVVLIQNQGGRYLCHCPSCGVTEVLEQAIHEADAAVNDQTLLSGDSSHRVAV